jgi:non-heme chloroperoxidase
VSPNHRELVLIDGAALFASASVSTAALVADVKPAGASSSSDSKGEHTMSVITTKDGVEIFYKNWGSGQPIVFNADLLAFITRT